ncbi:hypothetical protein LCGC14_1017680 [marine sediment metagenome]|uniref:Uncharacterized protein n=1 Tax=marine sediment metagenome TaxID=412755 RepID=A0A0F9QGN4_9ZZZZ
MAQDVKAIKERVAGALDKQAKIRRAAEAERRIRDAEPSDTPTRMEALLALFSGRSGRG